MRTRTRPALAVLALTTCALVLATGAAPPATAAPHTTTTVRFLASTVGGVPTAAAIERSAPALDVRRVRSIGPGLAVVSVATPTGGRTAVRRALAASPKLSAVSVDSRTAISGAKSPTRATDPFFSRQWDLWDASSTRRAGGYGIDAPRAWQRTLGAEAVVVAVLDTGITDHPDLAGAAQAPGYDFVSQGNGVGTGDGDGWDADPTDEGDACDALEETSSWHGTFVTGEIAAQHDGQGVSGIAPRITVEPVRVLGACGGTEADTIAAIEWASGGAVPGVPANAHPARVISMSLGSSHRACPAALQTAISDAIGRGSVVVAAAGNESRSVALDSPANCRGVVSVAATTRTGGLASYSNRGTAAGSPTIAAPGGTAANPVLGDVWTSADALSAPGSRPAIAGFEGTSMAAPEVAAATALLLSVRPTLTPAKAVARLTATATAFPRGSTCTVARCGAGIVNAGDLVAAQHRFVHASRAVLVGKAVVGTRLRADPGVWHNAPTRVRTSWYRDGTVIPGAVARTYRLRGADRGHRVSARVQVLRAGTVTASATTGSRRIH